jgi:hypothetical protein
MGEKRNAYRVLVGKSEGKRSLGRPRSRWEDKCNKDLKGKEWEDVQWIHVAQERDQ